MPRADSLDEHRVYYYRSVARMALQVSRGAYLPVLVDVAEYLNTPSLARLVPSLSVIPRRFTYGERMAMEILAKAAPKNRQQLERQIARAYLWADVVKCVANHHPTLNRRRRAQSSSGFSVERRLSC
jgi:hypothetical protein